MIGPFSNPSLGRCIVLAILVLAYFVAFPGDLSMVLAPLEIVLRLSLDISPWLYGVLAVALLAWAMVRVGGQRAPVQRP